MGIATSLFGERMLEQFALQAAHSHSLDQLEVQARLLFGPARPPRGERHEFERRIVERMANNASSMASTPGQKHRLYLGFKEAVIQRSRCGWGRRWLAHSLTQRQGRRRQQRRRDDHIGRGPSHANLPHIYG